MKSAHVSAVASKHVCGAAPPQSPFHRRRNFSLRATTPKNEGSILRLLPWFRSSSPIETTSSIESKSSTDIVEEDSILRRLPWLFRSSSPIETTASIESKSSTDIVEEDSILRRLPWFRSSSPIETTASIESTSSTDIVEDPINKLPPSLQQTELRPILSIAGGGRYFFWYLGVAKYLMEYFDLTQCELIGSSAGGLVAVLAACRVNTDLAVREAYRLSEEKDIWNRPGGLAGIWGGIVREWLDSLLPPDADERCEGRVKLIVTSAALPFKIQYLTEFEDRDDLINAAMATIHIPWFLDGSPVSVYKGRSFIDGSLWEFVSGKPTELLTVDNRACVVDYFYDEELQFERLDFVKLSSYEEVKALVKQGYGFAERTDASGGYEATLGPARKGVLTLALEYPARQLGKAFEEA